jgi:hypothetical protein
MTSPDGRPGRTCPVTYRYDPHALARPPDLEAETLFAVGGLYGNSFALESVLDLADDEPGAVTIVFNGDFNWFNIDASGFALINETVLRHRALRGNVETELAGASAAGGCGCGYPDSVGDAEVARSNEIMARLHVAAQPFPALRDAFARLPMHLVAKVGSSRVGIVHGDLESLAGWSYTPEALDTAIGTAKLRSHFAAADLDVIASTHTCTPLAAVLDAGKRRRVLFNNGAAGMPNFRGEQNGLITRISIRPSRSALYAATVGDIHIEAVPVRYDHTRWVETFLENWPAGSAAHRSYFLRMTQGGSCDASAVMRAL